MAKDLEMGYLLDFYGEVLTEKQREMLRQYYNDDLSLSEIGENFGITRQGARDAIKHGENALKELEEKVGFAARYRRVQQKLEELEQLVMSMVPGVMILYMQVTSSGFLDVLYHNLPGVLVMTGCLGVYLFSFRMGRKIVRIQV